MSRLMSAMALVLATSTGAAAAEPTWWWVFFTKGAKRDQSKEELERGQKAHLANLDRLYAAGHCVLAGPLGDDGMLRGSVLVKAPSREALLAHFEPDPFVQWGRLAIDASPWTGRVDGLGKPVEPFEMQQATLVILKKGPAWTAGAGAVGRQHAATLARLEQEGHLALAGELPEGGDRRAILLFRTKDPARVAALLGEDPAVKSGHLVVETHPQLLARGTIGDERAQ